MIPSTIMDKLTPSLIQAYLARRLQDVYQGDELSLNWDQTMLMLRSDDGKKYYFSGVGRRRSKTIQADRKTQTALPIKFGSRMAGIMMIVESSTAVGKKAKKATANRPAQRAVMMGETFSTRAINTPKKYQ